MRARQLAQGATAASFSHAIPGNTGSVGLPGDISNHRLSITMTDAFKTQERGRSVLFSSSDTSPFFRFTSARVRRCCASQLTPRASALTAARTPEQGGSPGAYRSG
jgi:hypothetical protein